ncbi:unnamed protein product [Cyclocybe aegerita]|uniref:Uncharacterized protein n=1 Tax=Cyclocybe aegerita TaxID=1973307 RepID=A0A8S0XIF8_CYCAE|nr:unnamed protein product [Cyclocybe aegerita]
MRRLALHASALNDAEYDTFTANLRDLALTEAEDVEEYEKMTIGVREARAWLRGRYCQVSASVIDGILRLFAPNLAQADTISGAEFFAVLRLVLHAESGKEVDRSLAFVQTSPLQGSRSVPSNPPAKRGPQAVYAENETEVDGPSGQEIAQSTPFHQRSGAKLHTSSAQVIESQTSQRTGTRSAPDSRASSPPKRHDELPPPVPLRRPYADDSITTTSTTHNPFSSKSHNPFVARPPRSEDGSTTLPPLPPRKPPPPPRHGSMYRVERSLSPSKPPPPPSSTKPAIPTKPAHHVSTLIKQSLQASKAAQSMKKAEEMLEKERVMQVLKSSSAVSGSYSLAGASVAGSSVVIGTNIHNQHTHPHRSMSPTKMSSVSSGSEAGAPPLPKRRHHHHQQPSPPLSAGSMEQVALATVPVPSSSSSSGRRPADVFIESPFRTPVDSIPPNTDDPESPSRSYAGPPPTHPDRKPHLPYHAPSTLVSSGSQGSNHESFDAIYGPMGASTPTPDSPTTRVFRSKSMHQPSPPPPPLPPPVRRKRPESVQVLGNGEMYGSLTRGESSLSRHASMSKSSPTSSHHRRSSLSTTSSHNSQSDPYSPHAHPNPIGSVQRAIANLGLHDKLEHLQPKLDKARYKAEAGLSRRGFVRDHGGRMRNPLEGEEEEGLMGGEGGGRGRRRPRNEDPDVDSDEEEAWRRGRGMDEDGMKVRTKTSPNFFEEPEDIEKDNLKWPAGEGWKPL